MKKIKMIPILLAFVMVMCPTVVLAESYVDSTRFYDYGDTYGEYQYRFMADNSDYAHTNLKDNYDDGDRSMVNDVYESIASQSPVCMYWGDDGFYFLSLSNLMYGYDTSGYRYDTMTVTVDSEGNPSYSFTSGSTYYNVPNSPSKVTSTYSGYSDVYYYRYYNRTISNFNIVYSDMYAFRDIDNAVNYLRTGDTSGAMAGVGPAPSYDSNQIYLDNFQMIVHASNSFDKYYVEFLYKPSQYLIDNGGKIEITIDSECDGVALVGVFKGSFATYNNTITIDLETYPSSCKLYAKDFWGDDLSFSDKRYVLGFELFLDTADISIDGLGAESICKVTSSQSFITFCPYVDSVYGNRYDSVVDFLNSKDSYTYSSSSDSSGNYTTNNDASTVDGYYYINESTDDSGNTYYTYYYYSSTGDKTEISSTENNNNSYTTNNNTDNDSGGGSSTVSGSGNGDVTITNNPTNNNNPTFNNTPTYNNNVNVTVEGDNINNDVINYTDNNTDSSDSESLLSKFLSFFNIFDNGFSGIFSKFVGWLPTEIITVIAGAIGIIAVAAVFKFFRG